MNTEPAAHEPSERIAIAIQLLRILGIFGVVLAVTDYVRGNYIVSAAGAAIALLTPLVLRLHQRPRFADLPVQSCLWLLFAMFLLGNLTQFPFYPEKAAWVTIFPFAYFHLTGLRNGSRWVAVSLLVMLVAHPIAPLLMKQPLQTSLHGFSHSVGAFILSAVFASMYERIRTKQAEQLQASAAHDALTELLNRHGFAPLADAALQHAVRFGQPFAIVLIDIDDFKQVNDRYGHGSGDQLLREFARVLTQQSRKSDLIARWGGEEFILLLAQSTPEKARLAADKIRCAIAAHAFSHGKTSASFGVALHEPGEPLETTINRADAAMYRAKADGKNRVEVAGAAAWG